MPAPRKYPPELRERARSITSRSARWLAGGQGNAMIPIRGRAEDYLAMRRALGFKLTTFGHKLVGFIDYLEDHDLNVITVEAALDWATATPCSTDPVHWSRRMMVARIFARHLAVLEPATPPASTDPAGFCAKARGPRVQDRAHPGGADVVPAGEEGTAVVGAAQRLPSGGLAGPPRPRGAPGCRPDAATGGRFSDEAPV